MPKWLSRLSWSGFRYIRRGLDWVPENKGTSANNLIQKAELHRFLGFLSKHIYNQFNVPVNL